MQTWNFQLIIPEKLQQQRKLVGVQQFKMNLPRISSLTKLDLMDIRCSTYATLLIFTSAAILATSFVTPYWLESGTIPNQRFQRLGLWEACFSRLHDHHYRYDRVISGCKWIFDEDYRFLVDYLEPGE